MFGYIFEEIEKEFKLPEVKYTAFSILTLCMQVVDDVHYLRKYFEIAINYSHLMTSEKVRGINQKCIELALSQITANSEDALARFSQAYRDHYISFVIDGISLYAKTRTIPFEFIERNNLFGQARERISLNGIHIVSQDLYARQKRPFYLNLYPPKEAEALKNDVLLWGSQQIGMFLSKIPNQRIRREYKKSLNYFMKLSPRDRDALWNTLSGRSVDVEDSSSKSITQTK